MTRIYIYRNPVAWVRAVRYNVRVRNVAEGIGMEVLQRLAEGADNVMVKVDGPRTNGTFLDTDLRVKSDHVCDETHGVEPCRVPGCGGWC